MYGVSTVYGDLLFVVKFFHPHRLPAIHLLTEDYGQTHFERCPAPDHKSGAPDAGLFQFILMPGWFMRLISEESVLAL